MSYTHTSAVVPCEADTFCGDCDNPITASTPALRRVTDTGELGFKIDWICPGECGPVIDVSDDALLRQHIAELNNQIWHSVEDRRRLYQIQINMLEDLERWLTERIADIDIHCVPSHEMREELQASLNCLRSASRWIR